jgi:uncharacterized lipoprotein YajG
MKRVSLLTPLALLFALSGCTDGTTTVGPALPPPVAQQAPDAFYTRVLGIVATNADYTEAPAIAAIVATTPEDSEPLALLP